MNCLVVASVLSTQLGTFSAVTPGAAFKTPGAASFHTGQHLHPRHASIFPKALSTLQFWFTEYYPGCHLLTCAPQRD